MSAPAPSRRALLGAAAALPLAALPAVADSPGRPPVLRQVDFNAYGAAPLPDGNPDAELIRLCEQHIANVHAYNTDGGRLAPENDPLWAAYERTRDAISVAEPRTLIGVAAKARTAKVEARNPDGTESPRCCPAEDWAWDIVHDVLRLAGETA